MGRNRRRVARASSYSPSPPPPPRRGGGRYDTYDRARSTSPPRPMSYLVHLPKADPAAQETPRKKKSSIRYRSVFVEEDGLQYHAVDSPCPIPELHETSRESDSVFDIVTEYTVVPGGRSRYDRNAYHVRSSSTRSGSSRSGSPHEPGRARRRSPRPVLVRSLRGKRVLDIHSSAILHALRSVIKYWPGLDLTTEKLRLQEPFRVLIHHKEELEEYRQACISTAQDETCDKRKDAPEHLSLLQHYLDEEIMPGVEEERRRHERGFATFQYLWLLFKPGMDVVGPLQKRESRSTTPYLRGFIVEKIEEHLGRKASENDEPGFLMDLWSLEYDGTSIGRTSFMQVIEPFQGEIEVATLEVVPADWPFYTFENKPVADMLRANGRKAYQLLLPRCLQHTGKSKQFPFHDVDGLVMVDMKTFYTDQPSYRPTLMTKANQTAGVAECYCSVCKRRNESAAKPTSIPFAGYDDIASETDVITDHQSFLFPSRLFAFHFRTRLWELVDVSNLSPARFQPDILSTLVMKEGRIEMIKALSQKYIRSTERTKDARAEFWSADFIRGKGKSQIILLHGKPGVGKTYTAECIAEHTQRPLMTLSCADIGTDPEEVEDNLIYHFTAATKWGAVLLIDEADIYMERRSSSDLERNSLVASFLRALETFEGMLFLTTNRVGAFDDAFVSRIHVKLYYPPLKNEERQKIWSSFIDKLARERSKDFRVTLNAKEYIEGSTIKSLDLNGREIRNAFQTAVALAEYDGKLDEEGKIMIEDHHLKQVAEMTREFQRYLNKLHGGDEDKRAYGSFERLPDESVQQSVDQLGGSRIIE